MPSPDDLDLLDPADNRFLPTIDRNSGLPYHEQIYRLLLDEIASGRLAPGQKLLQEKQYAVRLGVSLAPVRQAIVALAKNGYLERTRGRGTFVREAKVASRLHLLSSFTATLGETGLPVALRVLLAKAVPATSTVAAALDLPAGSEVLRLDRVAFLAGEPVALLAAHLPTALFPGITEEDLHGPLYDVLERRHGTVMTSARNVIEVVRAHPEHASHLQVSVGDALLQVEAVTRDQHGRPAEYSQVLYRSDRFRFEIESHRHDGHFQHVTGTAAPHGPSPTPATSSGTIP